MTQPYKQLCAAHRSPQASHAKLVRIRTPLDHYPAAQAHSMCAAMHIHERSCVRHGYRHTSPLPFSLTHTHTPVQSGCLHTQRVACPCAQCRSDCPRPPLAGPPPAAAGAAPGAAGLPAAAAAAAVVSAAGAAPWWTGALWARGAGCSGSQPVYPFHTCANK